jgi:uncharacterized LabA/DUF88 family protein
MRVTGYIDGMNFYEASKNKDWYPKGWCNWRETILEYCPNSVVTIKYFTTLYTGRDQKRAERQKLHLFAMHEVAKATIIEGSCRRRPLVCPQCKKQLTCSRPGCSCNERFVEKMTDVNIALHLFEDAIDRRFDRAYVVSSDVELIPAVHAALRRNPNIEVVALLPPGSEIPEDFAELQSTYRRRRVEAAHLKTEKMRRFPDDLPNPWNMKLPEHWLEDAGPRPPHPGYENRPPAKRRTAGRTPWYEESSGSGS